MDMTHRNITLPEAPAVHTVAVSNPLAQVVTIGTRTTHEAHAVHGEKADGA